MQEAMPHHKLHFPEFELTLDNAAMIAGLGYHQFLRKTSGDAYNLMPFATLPIA